MSATKEGLRINQSPRIEPLEARVLTPTSVEMTDQDLKHLEELSRNTLNELVHPEGKDIRASSNKGKDGMYFFIFGRDTIITQQQALAAYELNPTSENRDLAQRATKAMLNLAKWQGKKDDMETGEKKGKFPHQVGDIPEIYQPLADPSPEERRRGLKPWYVDPEDGFMKNWDSVDATPLWIIQVARTAETGLISLNQKVLEQLKNGLERCLGNLDFYGDFAGFKFDPERKYGGLRNKGWKDSELAYMYRDGSAPYPELPIKDVFVNALFWAALRYGEDIFKTKDGGFALELRKRADDLKRRFNSEKEGFLMRDDISEYYFAEALNGKKLTHVAIDPAMALWAYHGDETIIDDQYLDNVVDRVLSPDMFIAGVGIRNYNPEGNDFDYNSNGYHRDYRTVWGVANGMVAHGLRKLGHTYEASVVYQALLGPVKSFNSCIELSKFDEQEGKLDRYIHPISGQRSATDQAWTAGAVLEATQFLKKSRSAA